MGKSLWKFFLPSHEEEDGEGEDGERGGEGHWAECVWPRDDSVEFIHEIAAMYECECVLSASPPVGSSHIMI